MEQRNVGRSGLRVSDVTLGTMTWGSVSDADAAAAQWKTFRDAGGTSVDTAASYSDGGAETILGHLLRGTVARDEIVVSTKAGIVRRTPAAGGTGVRLVDASRRGMLSQLDASLGRLGLDHVDLWQVHTVDPSVPFEETMSALDAAVTTGKARYVGVSNYCGWRLAQAATWQRLENGRAPLVSAQMEYSLLSRGIEREVVPACLDLGIGIFSYSPLGGGVLTGKYRDSIPSDSRAATSGRVLADYTDPVAVGIVEAVATAAEGLGTTAVAVALSWLRTRPGVTSAIVGARTVTQLQAALPAQGIYLPIEIRSALDDVSAPPVGYPEDAH